MSDTSSLARRQLRIKVAGPERVAGPVPVVWHDRIGYPHRSGTCRGHMLDAHRPTHCLNRPRDGEFKVCLAAVVVLSGGDL